MDGMLEAIRRHKVAFLVAVGVVMVATVVMVTVMSADPEKGTGPGDAPAEPAAAIEEAAPAQLDARQQSVSDILTGCRWGGGAGSGRLEIGDGTITEIEAVRGGTDERETTWRMGEVSMAELPSSLPDSDSLTSFVIYDADGEAHVAYLVTHIESSADGSQGYQVYQLASDAFAGADYYTTAGVAEDLEVEGLDRGAVERLGGDEDAVEAALRDYAMSHDTSCYLCRWDETLLIDYGAGTVAAGFDLISNANTDEPASSVTLTFSEPDGTLEVTPS